MDTISGSFIKPTPLFSFYTIVDMDASLINLIIKKYYDKSVFDFTSVMDIDYAKFLSKLYFRTDPNPLSLFLVDESKKDFVDECYQEFIETKQDEIVKEGITTDILNLIDIYSTNNSDILPSVFYYNDIQKEALLEIPMFRDGLVSIYHIDDLKSSSNDEIMLCRIKELEHFHNYTCKTFYIASNPFNLERLNSWEEDDMLKACITEGLNSINVIDLYKHSVVMEE